MSTLFICDTSKSRVILKSNKRMESRGQKCKEIPACPPYTHNISTQERKLAPNATIFYIIEPCINMPFHSRLLYGKNGLFIISSEM